MTHVVVARIGKPHGLRGEVTVQVHTDAPQERFVVGASFATEPPARGPLTLRNARLHNGIQLLTFDQASDRTSAEALRDTRLLAAPDETEETDDEGWYADELVGLTVVDPAGERIGAVTDLLPRPAQDLLEIAKDGGGTAYLPLVAQIVTEVDVEGGRVVVDAPPGLLDLEG